MHACACLYWLCSGGRCQWRRAMPISSIYMTTSYSYNCESYCNRVTCRAVVAWNRVHKNHRAPENSEQKKIATTSTTITAITTATTNETQHRFIESSSSWGFSFFFHFWFKFYFYIFVACICRVHRKHSASCRRIWIRILWAWLDFAWNKFKLAAAWLVGWLIGKAHKLILISHES